MSITKRVYLHIGHGKTGSSALQTCLAQNHSILKENGYLYPEHQSFKNALKGHVSSGNISPASDENWVDNQLIATINSHPKYDNYIFSAESLFNRLNNLFRAIDHIPNSWELHVLLAVRNPVEMIVSHHQQAIKRGGISLSLGEFIQAKNYRAQTLRKSAMLLKRFQEFGIRYSIVNYSIVRMGITSYFAKEIGVSQYITLDDFQRKLINRSMSASELSLLAIVNLIYGKKVGFRLSDALVNSLPEIKPDSLPISDHDLEMIKKVNKDYLEEVNRSLPSDASLNFNYKPTVSHDITTRFTNEQIEVIKNTLKK